MVNMMLWTMLSVSAASAYGAVMPRDTFFDLAAVIRNDKKVQGGLKSTERGIVDGALYSEIPLKDSKIKLDNVLEDERRCLYIHNFVKSESASLDINPNSDYPDRISGGEAIPLEITTSVAKINSERLGWNKEKSTEVGGSATIEASVGVGVFSSFLSATVYGNQRTTGGQNGESSKQTEWTYSVKSTENCPANSICRIVTWTYIRTIKGTCSLTPYVDSKCLGRGDSKLSLGLFPTCPAVRSIALDFFNFNYDNIHGELSAGPVSDGITMQRPEYVHGLKQTTKCSFSYALRTKDGEPVKAQALLTESLADTEKSQVKDVPEALRWYTDKDGDRFCLLKNNWFWLPSDEFFIPVKEGGLGKWETRTDLPKPKGLDEKCPPVGSESKMSARAEDDSIVPPPKNTLYGVKIISSNVPEFLTQLGNKENNAGFVANLMDDRLYVEEPGPVVKGDPKSIHDCIDKLKQ